MTQGAKNLVRRTLTLIQRYLDGLYRTDHGAHIEHFVIGEGIRDQLAASGAIEARSQAREEVYVLEQGDDMSLAVYIDAAACEAMEELGGDGTLLLDDTCFADFCVALEGVSHFVLLAQRASADKPVTQLELELQAEVDKYLAARLLTWRENSGPLPRRLRDRLFADFTLAKGLNGEQRERYRFANRLARRYCDFLERSFLAERRMLSLFRELRSFFHAPQGARLARIKAA